MNQMEILRRLDTIIPEITRTKDPEGVMLKYASKENFAPAHLEKLGHVFNAAKTMAFMDKSKDRGGSFNLVDVPEMVSKYTQPLSKNSSVSREATLVATTHVKSASAAREFARVPNFMKLHLKNDVIVKEASQPVDEVRLKKEAAIKKANSESEQEMLGVMALEADENYAVVMDKLAAALYQRDISFAKVEHDVIDLYGEGGIKSANDCSRYLTGKKFKHNRAENHKPSRLPYDSTGLAEMFKEASEIADFKCSIVKYANTLVEEPEVGKSEETRIIPVGTKSKGGGDPSEDQVGGAPKGGNPTEAQENGQPRTPKDFSGKQDSGKKEENPYNAKSIVDAVRQGLKDRREGAPKRPDSGVHPVSMTTGFLGKTLADLMGPKKNHTQRKVDEAHDDAKFSTTLQRLIVTDPIISEHDPEDVASLASSIRAVAPDGARDPNYLRFALREALQYGALPSHTYKDMADAQGKIDTSHKIRTELDNARYAPNA